MWLWVRALSTRPRESMASDGPVVEATRTGRPYSIARRMLAALCCDGSAGPSKSLSLVSCMNTAAAHGADGALRLGVEDLAALGGLRPSDEGGAADGELEGQRGGRVELAGGRRVAVPRVDPRHSQPVACRRVSELPQPVGVQRSN